MKIILSRTFDQYNSHLVHQYKNENRHTLSVISREQNNNSITNPNKNKW